jgi:hypothetical protein
MVAKYWTFKIESVSYGHSKPRAVIEILLAENKITNIHRCLTNVYGDMAVDRKHRQPLGKATGVVRTRTITSLNWRTTTWLQAVTTYLSNPFINSHIHAYFPASLHIFYLFTVFLFLPCCLCFFRTCILLFSPLIFLLLSCLIFYLSSFLLLYIFLLLELYNLRYWKCR